MKKKISKFGILCVLLLLMAGCTASSQWKADALVDELCAKDGGNKAYETVTLPKERFNEWGQFVVPDEKYAKPTDEYYRVLKTKDVQSSTSNEFGGLSVVQHHWMIYRRSDHKILGENIGYFRQGGDIPGSWMPSSYSCNQVIKISLEQLIFLKSSN